MAKDTVSKVTSPITGNKPSGSQRKQGLNFQVGTVDQDKDDNVVENAATPTFKNPGNPSIVAAKPMPGRQNKESATVVNDATPIMKAARAKRLASLKGGK